MSPFEELADTAAGERDNDDNCHGCGHDADNDGVVHCLRTFTASFLMHRLQHKFNKAIVGIRLFRRSGAAPGGSL